MWLWIIGGIIGFLIFLEVITSLRGGSKSGYGSSRRTSKSLWGKIKDKCCSRE